MKTYVLFRLHVTICKKCHAGQVEVITKLMHVLKIVQVNRYDFENVTKIEL